MSFLFRYYLIKTTGEQKALGKGMTSVQVYLLRLPRSHKNDGIVPVIGMKSRAMLSDQYIRKHRFIDSSNQKKCLPKFEASERSGNGRGISMFP